MSQHTDDQKRPVNISGNEEYAHNYDDVERYLQANLEVENNRQYIENSEEQIAGLKHSTAVDLFQKQVGLLQKRLVDDPTFFQQMFISEGSGAIT
ncbi:MAG: hypothetical protein QNL03_03940, partial [Gammaproteobacteria bacterium]|nr:hypothetical protein [Gammaproteobacteria bacterium]